MCVCAPTSAPRATRINTLPRTFAYAPQTRHAHSQTSADTTRTSRRRCANIKLLPDYCHFITACFLFKQLRLKFDRSFCVEVKPRGLQSVLYGKISRRTYHCRIVGAITEFGIMNFPPLFFFRFVKALSKKGVCTHSARYCDFGYARALDSALRSVEKLVDRAFLE